MDHVRELVREKLVPRRRGPIVFARAEENVLARREGNRAQLPADVIGLGRRMNSHITEIVANAAAHLHLHRRVKRLTAATLAMDAGLRVIVHRKRAIAAARRDHALHGLIADRVLQMQHHFCARRSVQRALPQRVVVLRRRVCPLERFFAERFIRRRLQRTRGCLLR
ncbi:MAG TPA: hypothetical protein VFF59_05610 [Anaerolineae bacterium]|nr:hypothetical protein [Anaerolineae bacterium]